MPLARVDAQEWIHAPRLTLIDEYRGTCLAGDAFEPDESAQRDVCNCGYASGRCDRFPVGSPDAVRFSVIAEDRILWVLEKDHVPVEHGMADDRAVEGILGAQIRAFAESYRLRR
jgi:hypothetical protein